MFLMPVLSRITHQPATHPSTAALPQPTTLRRKHRAASVSATCLSCLLALSCIYLLHASGASLNLACTLQAFVRRAYLAFTAFDWRASAAFRVTDAIKVSIAMSMALGVMLGIGVGLVSGLEPAVVIGVSASMAMGCVFVMSFAILHGVNALRAVSFALFVSVCLPFGFGIGFGIGVLIGVFLGLEDPDDIREKTTDFVHNFSDFVKVVTAFTLEIL